MKSLQIIYRESFHLERLYKLVVFKGNNSFKSKWLHIDAYDPLHIFFLWLILLRSSPWNWVWKTINSPRSQTSSILKPSSVRRQLSQGGNPASMLIRRQAQPWGKRRLFQDLPTNEGHWLYQKPALSTVTSKTGLPQCRSNKHTLEVINSYLTGLKTFLARGKPYLTLLSASGIMVIRG